MTTWEELSKEYQKEIIALWNDMRNALFEFESGMPKSFRRGMSILENSLDFSVENVRMLSNRSVEKEEKGENGAPNVQDVKLVQSVVQPIPKIEKVNVQKKGGQGGKDYNEDCFKWLRSS